MLQRDRNGHDSDLVYIEVGGAVIPAGFICLAWFQAIKTSSVHLATKDL